MKSVSGTALDGEIHSHNRYLIVGNRRNLGGLLEWILLLRVMEWKTAF